MFFVMLHMSIKIKSRIEFYKKFFKFYKLTLLYKNVICEKNKSHEETLKYINEYILKINEGSLIDTINYFDVEILMILQSFT